MKKTVRFYIYGRFDGKDRPLMSDWYAGHGGSYGKILDAVKALRYCRKEDPDRKFYIQKRTTIIEQLSP